MGTDGITSLHLPSFRKARYVLDKIYILFPFSIKIAQKIIRFLENIDGGSSLRYGWIFYFFSEKICISTAVISEPSLTAAIPLILSVSLPSFLRFDVVELDYRIDAYEDVESISIGKKCEWIQMILKSFKQALNGSKLQFLCNISYPTPYSEPDFTDHSMLLEHIGKELLPICNACRSYKFYIKFYWNYGTAKNVIAGILQFVGIDLSSDVQFSFYFDNGVEPVDDYQ